MQAGQLYRTGKGEKADKTCKLSTEINKINITRTFRN